MSVRAYKIEKISKFETFNLWHDELFMEIFEEIIGLDVLSIDGTGYFCIDKEQLKEMKRLLKEKSKNYNKEERKRTIEIFKKIEKDMGNRCYASYICF